MRSEGYCSWVCLSVCLLSHISPMERLFILKTLSRTQRATKVKKFVGFSLKPLRCRDPALPPLYGHAYSRPFFHAYFSCTRMRISRVYTRMIYTPPRVQHFSAFHCTLTGILIQVNKKFCELKRGNRGIVEKAQETRFGMSPKYIADTVG